MNFFIIFLSTYSLVIASKLRAPLKSYSASFDPKISETPEITSQVPKAIPITANAPPKTFAEVLPDAKITFPKRVIPGAAIPVANPFMA